MCKLDHLLVIWWWWWWWWEDKGGRVTAVATTTIQLVLAPRQMCLFNALARCRAVRSVNVPRREREKQEKRIECARKEKKRNNGLMCVAARYPLRTSNFDTRHVCTPELTHSLSYVVACSSKQTNKSSKINYERRWETSLGLRTTERRRREEKEANELCYRHTHTHTSRNEAWKAHFSPFLSLSLLAIN